MSTTESQPLRAESHLGHGAAMVTAGWIVDFSAPVVEHYDRIGRTAGNLRPGEFVPFRPGEYLGLSLPLEPLPVEEGLGRYQSLAVLIDDSISIRFGDYPRFPSYSPDDLSKFRGGPTLVPVEVFPEGFAFGADHSVRLFEGREEIWGPADRWFAGRNKVVYHSLSDGEGKLVADISGLDEYTLTGQGRREITLMPILTDPVFGVPTGGTQVDPAGNRRRLEYQLIGVDYFGDAFLFNEGIFWDVKCTPGHHKIEIDLPNRGTGFACILFGGYSEKEACRADATVR